MTTQKIGDCGVLSATFAVAINFAITTAAVTVWVDRVLQLPIFCVVPVKMSLHTKIQPNTSINAARADFIGYHVPT